MGNRKINALILDDEFYLGQILAQALNHEGMNAASVTDVDSAIDKLKSQPFDIVISDIYLPGKTGKDFFNYTREFYPDLPFIFMTGNPNLEMAVDLLKKGGYDYIVKPFMISDFVKKVKNTVSESRRLSKEKGLVKDLKALLKQRLEELRIYQDIIESTEDGLLVLDLDGTIVKTNSGFQKMTGWSDGELLGHDFGWLKDTVFSDITFEGMREEILQHGVCHKEVKAGTRNEESWICNLSFFPIRDEEGKTFAYATLMKDVTASRKMERALIGSLQKTNLAQEAIIFGLARLAEYRDQETGFHLERIRNYCKTFAEELGQHPDYQKIITDDFIKTIFKTAPLHDIGKVGIPDYILLKPGKLTPIEFEIMKSHTIIGYQTLASIRKQYGEMDFLNMGIEITYCHHERYDGQGYPRGLRGEKIPLPAQILSFADVYDALTTQRAYKKAFSHEESLELMKAERGKHFSPTLLDIFLAISDKFDTIRKQFLEAKTNQYLAI